MKLPRGKPNEPMAIKPFIDWSILGGPPRVPSFTPVYVNHIKGEDATLSDELEEFWRIKSYGSNTTEL